MRLELLRENEPDTNLSLSLSPLSPSLPEEPSLPLPHPSSPTATAYILISLFITAIYCRMPGTTPSPTATTSHGPPPSADQSPTTVGPVSGLLPGPGSSAPAVLVIPAAPPMSIHFPTACLKVLCCNCLLNSQNISYKQCPDSYKSKVV
jgi:hypothetical protein